MSDLTGRGDSFVTNALLDNVLIAYGASCDARAALYVNGRDLTDPLLSPIYGDMHGFPPTILTTGTRDLLLSNTVRVHRKLRSAGVEAGASFEGRLTPSIIATRQHPKARKSSKKSPGFLIAISENRWRARVSSPSGNVMDRCISGDENFHHELIEGCTS